MRVQVVTCLEADQARAIWGAPVALVAPVAPVVAVSPVMAVSPMVVVYHHHLMVALMAAMAAILPVVLAEAASNAFAEGWKSSQATPKLYCDDGCKMPLQRETLLRTSKRRPVAYKTTAVPHLPVSSLRTRNFR